MYSFVCYTRVTEAYWLSLSPRSKNPLIHVYPHFHAHPHTLLRPLGKEAPHTQLPPVCTQDISFGLLELTHDNRQWLAVSLTQTHCLKEQHETGDLRTRKENP